MLKSTRVLVFGLWVLVVVLVLNFSIKHLYSIILKVAYSKLAYLTPALVLKTNGHQSGFQWDEVKIKRTQKLFSTTNTS